MTLQEVQALPDDQLIEKVAVEVMGWKERSKFNSAGGQDRSWWKDGEWVCNKDGEWVCNAGKHHWNPLTDWNHTMEVVEKMKHAHGWFKLSWIPKSGEWEAEFEYTVYDKDPRRAVVIASLLAR